MLQLGEEHSSKTDKSSHVEGISGLWGYSAYSNQIHGFYERVLLQNWLSIISKIDPTELIQKLFKTSFVFKILIMLTDPGYRQYHTGILLMGKNFKIILFDIDLRIKLEFILNEPKELKGFNA